MQLNMLPLLSSLRHKPAGALLVLAQIAITLAVLCNATSIVSHTVARIDRPAGFDTRDTFIIIVAALSKRLNISSAEREDLAYLRGLPDVVDATVIDGTPLTDNGFLVALTRSSRGPRVRTSMLPLGEHGLHALGVPLLRGRNFRAAEVISRAPAGGPHHFAEIIVTESLAHALFPHGQALGSTVYNLPGPKLPLIIIGITRNFMGPQFGQPAYNAFLAPDTAAEFGDYELLVRARPGRRDAVLQTAQQHIAAAHPDGAVALTQTLAEAQRRFNADSRNMAIFLAAVTALMLAVCGLGLFGLTAFNVSTRTKQIGVRRAIGARRRDIVAHFIAESALVLGGGVVLGTVLALAAGQWLSDHYGEPRLDLAYVLIGVAIVCIIGQLAAWQPARRAAAVPPSVATRTI